MIKKVQNFRKANESKKVTKNNLKCTILSQYKTHICDGLIEVEIWAIVYTHVCVFVWKGETQ